MNIQIISRPFAAHIHKLWMQMKVQTGSLAGRVMKAHMLAQNFFKGSAVLDYLLQ